MNREDRHAVDAVYAVLPQVAQAINWSTKSLSAGGRIIYVGAGTSGRLGLLDAVECPPTFGVSPDVVVGIIAGGKNAFVKAREGAEDSEKSSEEDLKNKSLCEQGHSHWPSRKRTHALCGRSAPIRTLTWMQDRLHCLQPKLQRSPLRLLPGNRGSYWSRGAHGFHSASKPERLRSSS